jgi:AcrR family transcriptional regulator
MNGIAMTNIEKTRVSKKTAPPAKITRHAEKTAQTRMRLLNSAETIFARDGFEAAKLEEIAADAGYTRGALYANFDSKEELFIELLAEEVERRMARASERTAGRAKAPTSNEELYRAMRKGFVSSLKNPAWNILFLEYKLFVLRHPAFRDKISKMQAKAYATMGSNLEQMFAGIGMKTKIPPLAAGMALAALANTLNLDLMIGKAVSEREVDEAVSLLFDALSGKCS